MNMEYTQEEKLICRKLAEQGGTGNVMAFLGYAVAQFDEGFIIANQMQNKDLVKLLYSNINKNLIVVEATLLAANVAGVE